MNKIIIIAVIILIAVGGYFLFGKGYKSSNSGANQLPSGNTENKISIKNSAFNPQTLNIKTGTAATWTNEDSIPHKIKSNAFGSGDLNKGDSFQFTFSEKGTFDYTCAIHPFMTGQIIVE